MKIPKFDIINFTDVLNREHFNKKVLMILLIASLAFYYPVIYAGSLYADDVFRVFQGSYGWSGLGRFFANDIARLYSGMHGDILDISPLTWFLCIGLIGFCAKLIFVKFNPRFPKFAFTLALVFIINPFFIQNLLYRYDSLGMTLALFFVVLSFSINDDYKNYISALLKVILLIISLNFYQPMSNLFLGLVGIEFLLMTWDKAKFRSLFKFILLNVAIFVVANIFYLFELKVFGVSSRGQLLPLELNSILKITNNLIEGFIPFVTFWSYYKKSLMLLLPFLIISLSYILIHKNYHVLVGFVFSSIIVIFSGIGGMAILTQQIYAPRTLSYFPILMMLVVLFLSFGKNKLKWAILIPIFYCFIFSSNVGNILKTQSEFEKPIFENLTVDLYSLKNINFYHSIGGVKYSHYLDNILKEVPFNGYLERSGWNTVGRIMEYDGMKQVKFEWSGPLKKTLEKYNKIKNDLVLKIDRTPFYKIYTYNKVGYIVWL